jgi:hypothetical protein
MPLSVRVDVCSQDAESYLAHMLAALDEVGYSTKVFLDMDGRGNKWWIADAAKDEQRISGNASGRTSDA